MFSGSVHRDELCIIFKELDKKCVGTVIESKINSYEEHRVVISCADDADFCISSA